MDWDHNISNIKSAVLEADRQDAAIICLPELCITGHGCDDAFQSKDLLDKAKNYLKEIATYAPNRLVFVGLPFEFGGCLYNTTALLYHGLVQGLVAKQHLAGDGIFYEGRQFKAWPGSRGAEQILDMDCRIGNLMFNVNDIKIGVEICEDAWVSDRPGAKLAGKAVDIIINPSASNFSFGKHEIRKRFVIEGSRAFNCAYVYSNLLGNEAGRIIYDGDCFIASEGHLVAESNRFSYRDFEVITAVIDVEKNATNRRRTASFMVNLEDHIQCKNKFRSDGLYNELPINMLATENPTAPIKGREYNKFEEFDGAACLGLRDFLRKSGLNNFMLSLSGGADSTTVACLVYLMTHRSLQLETPQMPVYHDFVKDENKKYLTCVYQATKNSSAQTEEAAQKVSEGLGAQYLKLDVNSIVDDYTTKICVALNRDLNWQHDDIALQNIQARVRAPSIWMLANIKNALLLATSNRSEAAVGYFSLGGDDAGSLSPLAGIDKTFILEWLKYARQKYCMTFLDYVIKQKPTAELRPGRSEQTDEKDLMPYAVLDRIEELAIRDKKSPADIFRILDGDAKTKATYIDRFFRLWCRNQFKRERIAVSFNYGEINLDPKSWCRFPVLNSGMKKELEEMWALVS